MVRHAEQANTVLHSEGIWLMLTSIISKLDDTTHTFDHAHTSSNLGSCVIMLQFILHHMFIVIGRRNIHRVAMEV